MNAWETEKLKLGFLFAGHEKRTKKKIGSNSSNKRNFSSVLPG